jgi:uncharacterized membrane protein YgaE (UPF0421/DUF939 family)
MKIFELIRASRPRGRKSLEAALIFAGQTVICAFLLLFVYERLHGPASSWALISAVLVMQPGFQQSMAASATRIVANLIGGLTAAAIGLIAGHGPIAISVGFVLIILICEYLRLDMGVMTACVSVVIVLGKTDGDVVHSGLDRVFAVVLGCLIGLIVQLLSERLVGPIFRRPPLNEGNNSGPSF